MPVSHLNDSVATMLAAALNELTGGSFSHLTTSEAELLARVVSEMTGSEYSHLTTGTETLWELMLTQATTDGITFDRLTQSPEQIMAIIANNVSGEEPPAEYEGPLDLVPSALIALPVARALGAAALGDPLYTLYRADDAATEQFSSNASTGAAPSADISTFLGASAGNVHLWNDNTGPVFDGFDTGAWVASGINNLPALTTPNFAADSNTAIVINGSFTLFAVAKSVNNYLGFSYLNGDGSSAIDVTISGTGASSIGITDASGNFASFTTDATLDLSGTCIVEVVCKAGSHALLINGVSQAITANDSGVVGASTFTPEFLLFGNTSLLSEMLLWEGDMSAPNRLAIRQNQAAEYGITL